MEVEHHPPGSGVMSRHDARYDRPSTHAEEGGCEPEQLVAGLDS